MGKSIAISLFVVLFSSPIFTMDSFVEDKDDFPIVLIHGLFGFNSLAGVAYYWGKLPQGLREHNPQIEVFIAELSQAHDIPTLAMQLHAQLLEWPHERYRLVGHSLGGLVARYMWETHPEKVASVTTICTPHRGSRMADALYRTINFMPFVSGFVWKMGNLACHTIGLLSGHFHQQDLKKAIECLTTDGAKEFNKKFPRGMILDDIEEELQVYSFGTRHNRPQRLLDIWGVCFSISGFFLYGTDNNDGIVDEQSMHFGRWIGAFQDAHHILPTQKTLGGYSDKGILLFEQKCREHFKQLR